MACRFVKTVAHSTISVDCSSGKNLSRRTADQPDSCWFSIEWRCSEDSPMLAHLYRQHTISSRCIQATGQNRSMLSLPTVRTQSSRLLKRIEMLQMRREPWIQSRLCECCQMCQLQCATHGWFTGMSSEDFLSSREETTTRREERN